MSARPDDSRLRALMTAYQAGHLDAFEELYGLLAPPVRGFLASRPGMRVRAEDLTQETFLQLHRARHTYDAAYPVLPWALAVARNVWRMDRRTASRRPNWDGAELPEVPVPADAEGYADRTAVRAALRQVAPGRREAVVAHHVWGWSFREIAARAGVRETAAKLRSSRGVAQLRALLRGGSADPSENRHD
jgi:RNA polymerase sigma-70 factor, ECF subfamily